MALVAVQKFESKSHGSPDEVRNPSKTLVEIVRLEGCTFGRVRMEPGWRWSECIKPIVQTQSCELSHVGHAVAGRMTIQLKDGSKKSISAGDSYAIPPGHDAWVEGSEPFVGIEILSAEQFAKP